MFDLPIILPFTLSVDGSFRQFSKVQSLLGHEDWVRDVAFAAEGLLIHTTVHNK